MAIWMMKVWILEGDGFDTQDGSIVGTVAYLSPEQARGEITQLTVASDQYALGLDPL